VRNMHNTAATKRDSRRSQQPRGLRRRSLAARLVRLWVRIPSGSMSVCDCCVLSGRGLCVELITPTVVRRCV